MTYCFYYCSVVILQLDIVLWEILAVMSHENKPDLC